MRKERETDTFSDQPICIGILEVIERVMTWSHHGPINHLSPLLFPGSCIPFLLSVKSNHKRTHFLFPNPHQLQPLVSTSQSKETISILEQGWVERKWYFNVIPHGSASSSRNLGDTHMIHPRKKKRRMKMVQYWVSVCHRHPSSSSRGIERLRHLSDPAAIQESKI